MPDVEVTIKTKVPLTSGKEAELTLVDGAVSMRMPVSWNRPEFKLEDLRLALEELDTLAARGS